MKYKFPKKLKESVEQMKKEKVIKLIQFYITDKDPKNDEISSRYLAHYYYTKFKKQDKYNK